MSNLILEIKDVSHSYDENETTLDNINLAVNEVEKVSIFCPSVSGKSTLLRLIAGLEKPRSGSISIKGEIVSTKDLVIAPEKRNLGLVVQEKALFPHLTVSENITFGIKKKRDKNKIVLDLLTLFKIDHLSKKCDAFFICLGDMPMINKKIYNHLIKLRKNNDILVPT